MSRPTHWVPGKRRFLEKMIRARLREVKVGVIPGLLAEVMDAERNYSPSEMAAAYLILLARRQAVGLVAQRAEDVREFVAKKVGGIVRRVERRAPLARPDGLDPARVLALTAGGGD